MNNEKTITINEDELIKKCAIVTSNSKLTELIKSEPSLLLAFAVFTGELTRSLFEEVKPDENSR